MYWLLKSLLGPGVWAVTFSVVYALHGTGCARGWTEVPVMTGTLHHAAMLAAWAAGVLACLLLVARLPRGGGLQHRLPRAGAWIGLGATLLTLLPVLIASSC